MGTVMETFIFIQRIDIKRNFLNNLDKKETGYKGVDGSASNYPS